jgi:hypothetical protein
MPLFRLCLVLLGAVPLAAPATEPARPESRRCVLRFAWWNFPRQVPELVLQMGRDRLPVSPTPMSLSHPIDYHGDPAVVLLKKVPTGERAKDGRPKFGWVPYATITLAPTDTDLGVLLVPSEADESCLSRTFDFSPESFPYGTVKFVNFTRARIACSLDGSVVVTEPGQTGRCPGRFAERTSAAIAVVALEADGRHRTLYSTKIILNQTFRTLIFILETDGNDDERYHSRCILDVNPYPDGATPSPGMSKSPGGKTVPSERGPSVPTSR